MLKLYEINNDYVSFLRLFDHTILPSKIHRKYVGILRETSGYKYFAPLTSNKLHHNYAIIDGEIKLKFPDSIGRKNIAIYRKADHSLKRFYGLILFSSMIPVPDGLYKECEIDKEPQQAYRDVLKDELRYINNNRYAIVHDNVVPAFRLYGEKLYGRIDLAKEWDLQKIFLKDLEKSDLPDHLIEAIKSDLDIGIKVEEIRYKLDIGAYNELQENLTIYK